MTQYIDKNDLEEYIKHRYLKHQTGNQDIRCLDRMGEDKEILSYLQHLEAKEIDLNNEIKNYWDKDFSGHFDVIDYTDFTEFAKHFFELGIAEGNKAQKGE